MSGQTEHIESTGNVFADMALPDADELLARARMGFYVRKLIRDRGLKQTEAATLLGAGQAEISKLINGKYHLFSEGRLIEFLGKLDQKVVVQITPRLKDEHLIEVVCA